ncbi:UNVERIFIED_CONTAM: ABC transporter G member 24 [Siphonaria sp. JEL0065]|nr:ABC transporter G member 24 [Siphonaria sp. JEL0065]
MSQLRYGPLAFLFTSAIDDLPARWSKVSYTVTVGGKRAKTGVEKVLLNKASGSLNQGDVVAILGGSGAGKSTLLNLNFAGQFCLMARTAIRSRGGLRAPMLNRMILFPHLTVEETLTYAATLRLPASMTVAQKKEKVDKIIMDLVLNGCRNNEIGTVSNRGISGGERKRVSIGVELVSNPQILFLDEPTSGLDASTSLLIIQLIRNLAKERSMIVLMTIHQPRNEVLNIFDGIILLTKGTTVWSGKSNDAIGHFESLGFPLPAFTNPSDFFLDVITLDQRTPESLKENLDRIDILEKAWQSIAHMQILFICVSQIMGTLFPTILGFPETRAIFQRERESNTYRAVSVYIAAVISSLPLAMLRIRIFSIPLYWMVGLSATATQFFTYYAILVVYTAAALCLGLCMGSAVPCAEIGMAAESLLVVVFIVLSCGYSSCFLTWFVKIFAGLLLNLTKVTWVLRWLEYISFIRYTYAALLQNELMDFKYSCDSHMSLCPPGNAMLNGIDVVASYGLDSPANCVPAPPCVSTTKCTASQCGTQITDNCGKPLTCAACPPPPPPQCVATTVCTDAQCGTSIFNNCAQLINCPACPSSSPTAPVATISQETKTLASASPIVIVVTATASPVVIVPSTSPSGGLIGVIAGIAILAIIAVGAFVYIKKGKKQEVQDPQSITMNNVIFKDATAAKVGEEISDLPRYTIAESPDAIPRSQIMHCVTAVPAFYCAITNYEPTKDGQLALEVGQRLYVTAVNADGWCRALIGRDEGWVHVDMLGPIG